MGSLFAAAVVFLTILAANHAMFAAILIGIIGLIASTFGLTIQIIRKVKEFVYPLFITDWIKWA